MPTYTYLCDSCREEYEIEQRISDPPISKCPKCGKKKAHRVITNGNFILKGGGWYSDGYSSKHGGNGSSSAKTETKTKSDTSDAKNASSTTPSNNSTSTGNSSKSSSTSASAV